MIDAKFTPDLSQTIKELSKLEEELQFKAVRAGLVASIAPVKKSAKSMAPKDSGLLEQSIGHRMLSKRAKGRLSVPNSTVALLVGATRKVKIGSTDGSERKGYQHHKLLWHEYGTKYMNAHPFLEPANELHQAGFLLRFNQGLAKHLAKLNANA